MGSRGASSGNAAKAGGGAYRQTADYKEAYADELSMRLEEAPIGVALATANRDDDTVETQMRGYASAIGDPIRAMENQRASISRELQDYKDAKSNSNLGTKEAMEKMISEYDAAIERMKRIKKNSKRPDLL